MTFRIGILGGGGISETHARAAREIPGVEITAVYGQNAEKAARLAGEYGGRAYSGLEAFLDAPLDVVLVGSPSGVHAEQAMAAARRGLHVLVEKPLDVSTERCDRLIEECERAGVKLGVFFQGRTAPEIAWLKRQVEAGALGELFLAAAQVRWYRPPEYYSGSRWRGTWALDGGGALMNQGIHTVDLLLWLLGDVARVSGRTRTALHDIEVEDTALALLEFTSGAVATLEATTAAYPGYPRRLELSGTGGTVVVEHDRVVSADLREPPAEPLPRGEADANASASSAVISDVRAHRRVLEDFLDAVRTGAPPLCDGREGRRSVEVVEAVYRSARTGEPVELPASRDSASQSPSR
ncbi:MAG: Gfo/Idh/MocA family oxidoreductase [Gemmatimonadota bacterium]|nr:Gfo/Idh/MocA family oxidoreductase [Gemmatimonadota bacterium]